MVEPTPDGPRLEINWRVALGSLAGLAFAFFALSWWAEREPSSSGPGSVEAAPPPLGASMEADDEPSFPTTFPPDASLASTASDLGAIAFHALEDGGVWLLVFADGGRYRALFFQRRADGFQVYAEFSDLSSLPLPSIDPVGFTTTMTMGGREVPFFLVPRGETVELLPGPGYSLGPGTSLP